MASMAGYFLALANCASLIDLNLLDRQDVYWRSLSAGESIQFNYKN
jgi:hypothetical protein